MNREAFLMECKEIPQGESNHLLEEVLKAIERSFSRTESDVAENYSKLALMVQGCRITGGNIEDTYQAAIKHLEPSEFEKGMFSVLIALEIEG